MRSLESFDLSTRAGRYHARQQGFDVPKRKAGGKPKPFWSFVEKTDGCWIWRGSVNPVHGYGYYHNGGDHRAHRYAFIEANGPIAESLVVCHQCDNKLCVRPDHLFVGTQADNRADCVTKGRHARGSRNSQAKLTEDQVRALVTEYRALIGARDGRLGELAARYGIKQDTIRNIANRAWRHVA